LSEHDLKDLWDGQDGVVSCTSFNPQNRVMGRALGVLRVRAVFLCSFAALRAKKCHAPLSEHDLKDLWDGQDGVVSCTSFNL
ncbi:MAG: hypothetical protein RL386_784, partial [Bacteroidota bacterium]